ncbi:MAG: serine--tRNA ligase [Candidatus Nealsonbacteria bacterium]|nr:serine--tRNA ligase [Candidatus Nealsonbacteria bacterium]
MLDIKFIRQNPDKVKEGIAKKQAKVDIDRLLELDAKKKALTKKIEDLKSEQNKISKGVKEAPTKTEAIAKDVDSQMYYETITSARNLKNEIKGLEPELERIAKELEELMRRIPNLPLEEVPDGKDDTQNVVLREEGKKPEFDFKPRDHMEIAEALDLIDTKRAAKVAGTRFGYIKGKAALLQFALINLAFELLMKEKFTPVVPPVMLKPEMMEAMGYTERGGEEIYFLEKDNLYLIGTSEQSIGAMHQGEIFEESEFPKRYAGFSTCFRREAGAYGKDTRGILRVHQFDKVEMFSFCHPDKSREEHKFLLAMEEKLMQALKIPYRVLNICAGDLGDPAAAKYDIEAWMPGQGEYRETHSTSNTTDYQMRRLNIKYRDTKTKKLEFVHALNGTAFAIGRMLIAIIENYQQENGSVEVPKVLQKYTGFKKIG